MPSRVTSKKITCSECANFNAKQCAKQKLQAYFGPVYGLGSMEGMTCKDINDSDCTGMAGIDQTARSFSMSFVRKTTFRISFGLECDKPIGETCERNFLVGGQTAKCLADFQ